jgi:hypothetical protein
VKVSVWAVLRALTRAIRRDLATWESVKVNNFFLFVALLIYGALVSGVKPASSYPFLIFLGFLLLFPLSSDPLDKIPASRLACWPLTRRDRIALRFGSLALSPILWLVFGAMLLASPLLALCFLLISGVSRVNFDWSLHRIPLPPGLAANHARQMFSLLDTWLAVLLAIGGALYRVFATHTDEAAFPMLAILVALALSTNAQSLFGLDSKSAMVRYRLLPLKGWQILLQKDAAFLSILLLCVAPLSAPAGMTFGFIALAIGHYPSVSHHRPQRRWRFASGKLLYGVAQITLGASLGLAASQQALWLLPTSAAVWLLSLHHNGRRWDAAR